MTSTLRKKVSGPIRQAARAWPVWIGWAAAAWSLGYGILGLLWSLGVPGFPFGEGDVPDARAESIMGATHAQSAAPVIAALGLAGAVVAILLARTGIRATGNRFLRAIPVAVGGAIAATLLLIIPDARPLTALAYAPVALVTAPFDLIPVSYFDKALPWPVQNLLIIQLGGLLWAGATLAYHRRIRGACGSCGRAPHHPAGWTSAASAARWGRVVAWFAFVLPLFYSVMRWSWAIGIPFGLSRDELRELQATGMLWAGAYLATFAALGGVLVLGLTYRWGEIWPRWIPGLAGRRVPPAFPIGAASTVTVALTATSGMIIRITDWTDASASFGNPLIYLPIWGAALGAATLAYRLRTRGQCRACGRGEGDLTSQGRNDADHASGDHHQHTRSPGDTHRASRNDFRHTVPS